jgi:hypothetical protein
VLAVAVAVAVVAALAVATAVQVRQAVPGRGEEERSPAKQGAQWAWQR